MQGRNLLTTFSHPKFGEVRTEQDEKNATWFCAKDVCDALGYSAPRNAVRRHVEEDDALKRCTIDSMGREQQTLFINESGMYALVLASKLPQAREFKHWVTSEVLPAIRRDGGYIVVREGDDRLALVERALNIVSRQLEEAEPKALYCDEVLRSVDCLTTTQVAKELGMTGVELNERLHRLGVQYRQSGQWLLYAEYARMGLAKSRTHSFRDECGRGHSRSYLVWTERGRRFIHYLVRDLFFEEE